MKTRLYLALFLLLPLGLSAQNLHLGMLGAMGVARMHTPAHGDPRFDSKFSNPIFHFQTGGAMRYSFHMGYFALEPELGLHLARLGGKDIVSLELNGRKETTTTTLSLYYLQMPLLLNLAVRVPYVDLFVAAGPQLSIGLEGTRTRIMATEEPDKKNAPQPQEVGEGLLWGQHVNEFHRFNLSLATRVGTHIVSRFRVYAYWDFSLRPIAKIQNATPWEYAHSFGAAFAYYFL